MDSLARAGAAILMVSSELPELVQVPIAFSSCGRAGYRRTASPDASQEEIMRLAALQEDGRQ